MTKRGLLAICVAAAVAGGTGTGIAAGMGALGSAKPTDNAWVQALSKKLGTTPEKLVEALKGVSNDRIDALVTAGTITQAQADKLKARIEATGGLGLRGGFDRGPGPLGRGGMHGGMGDPLATAATYLGLTRDALDTALDGGKALEAIAKEQDKTIAGLRAALLADAKTHIDALPAATAAQKQTLLDEASAHIDSFIAGAATPGHGLGFGHGGMGGHSHRGGMGGHGHRGGMDGMGGMGGGFGRGLGHGPGEGLPGLGDSPSLDQLPTPAA